MRSSVSFYVLAAGVRYRVPKVTLLRMAANVGVDYLLGAIPFLGDLFDFAWKSNQKNVELLRQRASVSPAEARRGRASDWLFVGFLMLVLLAMLGVGTTSRVVGSAPSPARPAPPPARRVSLRRQPDASGQS